MVTKLKNLTLSPPGINESDGFPPVTLNCRNEEVTSARSLYDYLGIKTRFDPWMKRMFAYGFVENTDYERLIRIDHTPTGGEREVLDDYALLLDCAKEIAMIQRTEQGRKVRQYFIAVEKWAQSQREQAGNSALARQVKALSRKIDAIEYHHAAELAALRAQLPPPGSPDSRPVNEMRQAVFACFNAHLAAHPHKTPEWLWERFWSSFGHAYNIGILSARREVGENYIDVAKRYGYLTRVHEFATSFFLSSQA
jgi:phage anti-repressor protein